MKPKIVFHIIARFDIGGAERVALNIAESESEGMEYHIVELLRGRTAFTKQMINELKAHHLHYHRSWIPLFRFHSVIERLAAFLFPIRGLYLYLRYHPQIIHTHTEFPDLATYCLFKCFPSISKHCKVVRTIHSTQLWTGIKGIGKVVERFFLSQKANIAISESVNSNYEKVYGERAPMIYNGLKPVPQQAYQGIQKGKMNILFAGRLEEQKGIHTLIALLKHYQTSDNYFFHIVGNGSLKQLLLDETKDIPNVSMHDAIFNLASYLASFDFLLMPSHFEGLSILSLEASFNGLPCIINNCPGLKDTLPSDWILKVKNNDLTNYFHLFDDVIPTLSRKILQKKAYDFVNTHFSLTTMQHQYEAVYTEKIQSITQRS